MTPLEAIFANMTIADLARMSGCSVEALVAHALGERARRTAPGEAKSGDTTAAEAKGMKAVGRGKLSLEKALAVLVSAREPVTLEAVRAKVGGSVPQVRAALQKLAKAGTVKIIGERRATRYHAV